MFSWGSKSRKNYMLLCPELQRIVNRALGYEIMDILIDCSFRNEQTQNKYYYADPPKSRVKWPNSKHNKMPSLAVDLVPVVNGKVSWVKIHCVALSGLILAAGKEEGVKLRWGGNWDMDTEPVTDQDFQDLVHYEIVT